MKPNKITIEKDVLRFREINGLSSSEAINIISLLLQLDVLTVFKPLSADFSGMCLKDSSNHRFMLINSNQSRGRQHFTIAHELYHLFVEHNPTPHICNPNTNKDPIEQSADMFAAALLMPENGIYKFIPHEDLINKKVSMGTILKLEHYFSVSRSALLYRLLNINVISKAEFERLLAIPVLQSARSYGYEISLYKPENEGLVIGSYGEKARILFEKGKISEGHYLELLRKINIDATEED